MSNARPERPPATSRALLAFAVLCAAAGAALGALAFWPSGSDQVVLEVTPVTAANTPDTLPPITAVPPTVPTSGDTSVEIDAPTPTSTPFVTVPDIELSPLADLLGVPGSAIPQAVEPRIRPRAVSIDDIELWGPVRAVGLEDDGELEVPDATEIGWYRYGSSPGRAGATVLAAHVSWNGAIGPFHQLGNLEPGARVDVRLEDDTLRTYEVVERNIYDKDSLPRERIWRTTGDEMLVLITCGGSFNPDISRYRQNIVVYAVPVASTTVTS